MANDDTKTREAHFYSEHPIMAGILIAIVSVFAGSLLGGNNAQSEMVDELAARFDSVDENMSLNEALEKAYGDYRIVESELNALKEDEASKKVLANARSDWDSGDHAGALAKLAAVSNKSGDCALAYADYSTQYVDEVLAQAGELSKTMNYEEAKSVLEAASTKVMDDSLIEERLAELSKYNMVPLSNLTVAASSGFEAAKGLQKDTAGNTYSPDSTIKGRSYSKETPAHISYYIGKKYKTLTGVVSAAYSESPETYSNSESRVEIRASVEGSGDVVLWEKEVVTLTTAPVDLSSDAIDLDGYDWLEFRVYSTGKNSGRGIPVLMSGMKLISLSN